MHMAANVNARPTATPRIRGYLFALLVVGCLAVASGFLLWARVRNVATNDHQLALPEPPSPEAAAAIAALSDQPHLVFRSTLPGNTDGTIAVVPLSDPAGPRVTTGLRCARAYVAAGEGLCLMADDRALSSPPGAYTFGPTFQPRARLSLGGYPSRARVSPDGRYAAFTVFVTGHAYSTDGRFSTRTALIDVAHGSIIADLEQFTVWRDGRSYFRPDFNFWGVTFARDSNRFYATLAWGYKTYLVEGDVAARSVRLLHENVECPSLSPDNTRVAYKKLIGDGSQAIWHLYVLDLATGEETPLAETNMVDDQVVWLDDNHILYARPASQATDAGDMDLWVVPADGSGSPNLLIPHAASPAVVR